MPMLKVTLLLVVISCSAMSTLLRFAAVYPQSLLNLSPSSYQRLSMSCSFPFHAT